MQTGNHEMILVIDFGGQYNQLIARRVRECGVYCEIVPYTYTLEQIKAKNPKGIIFTGGPNSVYGDDTPKIDPGVFELGGRCGWRSCRCWSSDSSRRRLRGCPTTRLD